MEEPEPDGVPAASSLDKLARLGERFAGVSTATWAVAAAAAGKALLAGAAAAEEAAAAEMRRVRARVVEDSEAGAVSSYPEHDRMMAVKDQSQAIGEFLEWLSEEGIVLARWECLTDCTYETGPTMANGGLKWQCRDGRMVGNPTSNKPGVAGSECIRCRGTGQVGRSEPRLVPAAVRIEALLAQHFDIDLDKIEVEKRAMLAALQEVGR